MYGANTRDLNLQKPCAELSATKKIARKKAKDTRTKMEATDVSGLSGNHVKEILACKGVHLSQLTDFLEGRVLDSHRKIFYSQDTLLMLRNQMEDC